MFLKSVSLHNIKKYKNHQQFVFPDDTFINTISGKNGSGKSTIFESIMLCQKAFFADLLEPIDTLDLDMVMSKQLTPRNRVAKELAALASGESASISMTIAFTEEEFQQVGLPFDAEEEHSVTITLTGDQIVDQRCEWLVSVNNNEEQTIISRFWNLENPSNIIVMLNADKNVYEEDFSYEKINLIGVRKSRPIIDFILDSQNIYQHMYDIMMNSYLHQRLNPSTPRRDDFVKKSVAMFSEIMDGVSVSNFSGNQIENQFVLLAKNTVKYDARNLSSGEKLVWYVILVLNYLKDIGLLIIDEPENHLHEQLAWKFVLFLQMAAEQNENPINIGQVFLITHAKNLIYNNFSSGRNYIATNDGLTPIQKEECEKVLRSCGISFVEDKVLFVEGQTETECLEKLCAQHNIKIKELANCTEILQVYKNLLKVKELVTVPKFVFMLDHDTRNDEDIQKLRDEDVDFFDEHILFLPVHEIENFLLDENVLAAVLNNYLKDFSDSRVEAQDVLTTMKRIADESLNTTKKKYLNYELDSAIKGLAKLVNQRDIVVTSKTGYTDYVSGLLSEAVCSEFVTQMGEKFDVMEQTYGADNWSDNWKSICDGKIVFNQTCSDLGRRFSMVTKVLKKKVYAAVISNPESSLSAFWNAVESKLN